VKIVRFWGTDDVFGCGCGDFGDCFYDPFDNRSNKMASGRMCKHYHHKISAHF